MKKLLVFLLVVSAIFAFAGDPGYYFSELLFSFMGEDSVHVNYKLLDGSTDGYQYGPHGVVVDPEGKIWVGFVYGNLEQFETTDGVIRLRGLHCFMPDGTPASFSPINFLDYPDGGKDTISAESYNSGSCRGLSMMADGSILFTGWSTLHKIDYMTGQGLARWYPKMQDPSWTNAAGTEGAHDPVSGLVFFGHVGANNKIYALNEDLEFVTIAVNPSPSLQRSLLHRTLADGTGQLITPTIWSGIGIKIWESDDPEFVEYVCVDTVGNIEVMVEDTLVIFQAWAECLDWVDPYEGLILYGTYTTPIVAGDKVKKPEHPHISKWVLYDIDNDEEVASFGKKYNAAVDNTPGLILPVNESIPSAELGNQPMTYTPRGAAVLEDGEHYQFIINDMDLGIIQRVRWSTTAIGHDRYVPFGFTLEQNYPNPFNPTTTISFSIENDLDIVIDVFDMMGKKVATVHSGRMEAGAHKINFDASNLASGTYVYQLAVGDFTVARRMTLIK